MIFTQQLKKIENATPQEAIKAMASHLRYIQDQLEYTLMNLDSDNISEINLDDTKLVTGDGTTWTGSAIEMAGKNGEKFRVGLDENNRFRFQLDINGLQMFYLTTDGELVFTERTTHNIDCGEWD